MGDTYWEKANAVMAIALNNTTKTILAHQSTKEAARALTRLVFLALASLLVTMLRLVGLWCS